MPTAVTKHLEPSNEPPANERVRGARRRLGLSQMGLARRASTTTSMLVNIEKYGYMPGSEVRARLALALRTTVAELWPGRTKGR